MRKLRALVDCVMVQVDKDPVFAEKLAHILLSDEGSERPTSKIGDRQAEKTFNPVLFLKDQGEAALLRQLAGQTDDDLRAVLRFQGLRKGKELKKLERTEMLREIVEGAQAKLKQGLVVAQLGPTDARDQQPVETGSGTPSRPIGSDSGAVLSEGTRTVLRFLLRQWSEAKEHERDQAERKAFEAPIALLASTMDRPDATHEDIRKAVQVCPAYPNYGRRTLVDLADAERDRRTVTVIQRPDGAVKWDIEPPKRGT